MEGKKNLKGRIKIRFCSAGELSKLGDEKSYSKTQPVPL